MATELRGAVIGALATTLTLVGGMALGVALGNWLFEGLPGHMLARAGVAALPALGGVLAAGAAWGWALARLFALGPGLRFARSGVFGFSLPVIAAAFLLFALEAGLLGLATLLGLTEFPVHRLFTALFVPAAFILTYSAAWALGRTLGDPRLHRRMAWLAGAAAALAFLAANLLMESRGWVVGAPGAAERNTMITVLVFGLVAAALVGGAVVGRFLAAWRAANQDISELNKHETAAAARYTARSCPAQMEDVR